jgi:hypothetical protein
MAGILSALGRGNQKKDPMRESAALTTVYLLEQNQKFEQFMRQKVDELESRVAAQQARLSTREEVEERELWAALESFEAHPEENTAAEPMLDHQISVDQLQPVAASDMLDGDEGRDNGVEIEAAYEPAPGVEPEEIPDYLALMSGAVTEATAPASVEPDIVPSVVEDPFEPDTAEFDESHQGASSDETTPIIEPENNPDFTSEDDQSQDISSAPQNDSASWPGETTEFPADDANGVDWANRTNWLENEDWPSQPYETFQVNRPKAEAVEEIWPDLALAEEVELLGRQKSSDNVISTVQTSNSQPTRTTEGDGSSVKAVTEEMIAAQGAIETEEAWQTTLPDGQKGEWT